MEFDSICIAGKNEIAVSALLHLLQGPRADKVLVLPNDHDDGCSAWQPSLKRFADEYGVPVVTLKDVQARPNLLFLSLEYNRLIVPDAFATDALYNLHFSALPAYKGMYTSAWPILNGEQQSGVTLHRIDAGIDTGDIIAQRRFDLTGEMTCRDLYFRYMDEGLALLKDTLPALLSGEVKAQPQPTVGASYYAKSSIDYGSLMLDVNQAAEQVCRQIRAFHFREFQLPSIGDFAIGGWQMTDRQSADKPGSLRLEGEGQGQAVLSTIDYDVELTRDVSSAWFDWLEAGAPRDSVPQHAAIHINDRNAQGWSPLIIASYEGNETACRLLLEHGADANVCNMNGTTPLMYSMGHGEKHGSLALAMLLQEHGADVRAKDRFGLCALDYARKEGYQMHAEWLSKQGES